MGRTEQPKIRKFLLIISLVISVAILGVFKYYNFFAENVTALVNVFATREYVPVFLNIALPLGISFYTFEAMSYSIDVYRRTVKPAGTYWDYLLFVMYFPHLIAGPIMRFGKFVPQILKEREITWPKIHDGLYLTFLGLFQKMFVADNLAKIVNPVFGQSTNANGVDILIAMYAFALQIFSDFAGYSNIARGLGMMMGFDIAVNFNTPFFSTNVQEFWNRWHVSLGHWVRDYIYMPLLGGLKIVKGNGRIYLALIISMTLVGFWHGAQWNFVIFGIYYGILLSLYIKFIKMKYANLILPKSAWGKVLWFWTRVIFIFHVTILATTIFRCQTIPQAKHIFAGLIGNFHLASMQPSLFYKLIGFGAPLMILQWMEYHTNNIFFLFKYKKPITYSILALMLWMLISWGSVRHEGFIYFIF